MIIRDLSMRKPTMAANSVDLLLNINANVCINANGQHEETHRVL